MWKDGLACSRSGISDTTTTSITTFTSHTNDASACRASGACAHTRIGTTTMADLFVKHGSRHPVAGRS